MNARDAIYDLLLDYANLQIDVERILVGVNWTLCHAGDYGIAATTGSRGQYQLNKPLAGRSLAELSLWIRKWDRQQSSIGLAAVNAAINREADMVYHEGALFRGQYALSNALEWFVPQLREQKVTILSPENPFSKTSELADLTHLPNREGALHPAAEIVLPKTDWLFIDGQSVADKTLPRALELAESSRIVLFGPQVPWLEEWSDFGVDYLLGSQIEQQQSLYETIAEGGELHSLQQAVSYRVCDLHTNQSLARLADG